ncbi:hypothetical protein ONE63_010879 [Megalurothrips usitatus]|uniref:Down syndrome cell adhesion molecule-like protein Dscam2 n=1 Tax=Megalurothrips usitatus TaxID=439358 RepID=A0AAV7XL88_9NEOP|nr:hypothetical protein ONE63_010879 [Megalurothrips usitatus]
MVTPSLSVLRAGRRGVPPRHGVAPTTPHHCVPAEAPTAPVGVEVLEAGSRWLSLGWSPEGSGATHHVLQFRRDPSGTAGPADSPTPWYNVTVSGGSGRYAKLSGLDPATAYVVRVLAANEVGVGPPSEPVAAQTLQEAPTAPPADVVAEALGPESLTVRWSPPLLQGGQGLLGYQVRYRAVSLPGQPSLSAEQDAASAVAADGGVLAGGSGGAPWVSRTVRGGGPDAGALRQEVVLHGLESFTRYEVTVRAFNEVGAGPASNPFIATTMEGVPTEPPGIVRCTPLTSQNVRVRWEPPPKAGRRGVLDGYKVFYRRRPPAGLPTNDQLAWAAASPEAEVKKTMNLETNLFGLAKFSNYTVQVAAMTSAGEGVRSEPVHCTTEEDVPGPPEQMKALAMSSDSILVTWTRPLEANGIINKYTVYMRPAQSQGPNRDITKQVMYVGGDRGPDLAYEVRRLKELERLDVWVTAATVVGEGPPTARVSQAPVSRVPARIASFSRTAAAGEGQMLTLPCRAVGVPAPSRTWRGPHGLTRTVAVNGGLGADHSEPAGSRAVLIGDGSLRLGPLSLQDAGNYSCEAVNVFGEDSISYRVVVVGPPAAPVLGLAAATDRSLALKWTPADAADGALVSGYVLQFKRELGEWQERVLDGEMSAYTLAGLRCGSPYLLSLAAVNAVGRGPQSNVLQASTKGAPPKVPAAEEVLSVNSSTASLFLDAWPVAGCPVTYFVVDFRARETEGRPGPWTLVANRAGPQQTVSVAGLSPASWYELRVAAHSDAGSTRHQFLFATRTKTGDLVPLELMPALSDGPGPLALPSPATMLVAIVSGLLCTAAVATCAIVAFRKRQYAGYRRGDAKTLDELENQRNHEHHVHHHGHGHHPGLHDQQLYSPSPARKAISSSLAGQKGSDTSDYEICPYATFSLANANQGGRQTAGGGTLTPSKSLASYSLQLHTFSQRDCYAEGPLPQRRPSGQQQQIYGARSRSKAPSAASVAAAAPRLSDSGEGGPSARARDPATASPPDGLSLEISCISSQQTLPMSLAVSQRRKATSPPHCRDRTRPRSLVGGGGGGGGCGGARYESDSSSPSDKLGQPHHGLNHHHYRARAHTPSRRSSKSQDNGS